jgi:stearoyl-CoA desaturase (delta-9 desaturase)
MCLGVFFVGFSWIAFAVCVGLYVIRMFAVTGFYHRYFSHKTFRTTRVGQFVFATIGASAVQRGPLWWAAHHRHHHRHSDTDLDSHSPHTHGFLWSHMLWFMTREHFPTRYRLVPDLTRFRELVFLDRYDMVVPVLLGFGTLGLGWLLGIFAPGLGTNGLQMLIWGFFVSTVLLFHGTSTINSLAHLFGRRRFETTDHSRNSFLLAIITLGEGWHNNHHHFPGTVRQGFYWWEFDPTFYGLKVMSWLGIIWDLRPVPREVLEGH